jgi:hypothetical protein
MFDKGFSTIKEEMRFKYVSVIDQMRKDNLMNHSLESVSTEKDLKEFIQIMQKNITVRLGGSLIPDFLFNEFAHKLFAPFKL